MLGASVVIDSIKTESEKQTEARRWRAIWRKKIDRGVTRGIAALLADHITNPDDAAVNRRETRIGAVAVRSGIGKICRTTGGENVKKTQAVGTDLGAAAVRGPSALSRRAIWRGTIAVEAVLQDIRSSRKRGDPREPGRG